MLKSSGLHEEVHRLDLPVFLHPMVPTHPETMAEWRWFPSSVCHGYDLDSFEDDLQWTL
jgi:hypothetical protein